MDKFFNSDNMVMRTLSKIFDIGWLTLIYLVFCIPIVTVGAATTSLYYVSAKVLRHNRSYVWREFWHSFKTNFLQSTIAWVVTAIQNDKNGRDRVFCGIDSGKKDSFVSFCLETGEKEN